MQNEAIHINWLIKSHWSCWWAKKRIGVILIQTFRHATNLVFDTCPVYTWSLLISFFAENYLFIVTLFQRFSHGFIKKHGRTFYPPDHFCWKCCTGPLMWDYVSRVSVISGNDSLRFIFSHIFKHSLSHILCHFGWIIGKSYQVWWK